MLNSRRWEVSTIAMSGVRPKYSNPFRQPPRAVQRSPSSGGSCSTETELLHGTKAFPRVSTDRSYNQAKLSRCCQARRFPQTDRVLAKHTTGNAFIEGDNLEVLKLLFKPYFGRIKLIYIDPPYNTGQDFVYPDNYADPL